MIVLSVWLCFKEICIINNGTGIIYKYPNITHAGRQRLHQKSLIPSFIILQFSKTLLKA